MRRRLSRSRGRAGRGVALGLGLGLLLGCSESQSPSGYGLRLVELTLTSEAVSDLRHGAYTETPVPCDAEIEGARGRCQVSVAGATTRDDLKKSFDLELAHAYVGRHRYRLSAMDGDPSGLRALVAFSSFQIAGLRVPRVEPVALWLNAEYLGLYLLIEPVDPDFFEQRGDRVHALYKARRLRASLESTQDVEAAFAKRADEANHSDLRALIQEIAAAARGAPHHLDDLVDRRDVLRYMAGSQFIHNWDGIFNNYFLARSADEPKFTLLFWDLDQTFGSVLGPSDGGLFEANALMRFLYADDSASYLEELRRLDELVTPEVVAGLVDEFEASIGEAYRHDRFLNGASLRDQAEALKRRAERQHEVIANP